MTETPEKILFNFRQHNFTKVTGTIFQQSLTRLLNSHWHDCLTVVAQLVQQHCETLSQCCGWRCHNVVAWSKMKAGATSISNNGKTSLSDVVKTLPLRYHNVTITLSTWFLGHFITDNPDFFPAIKTWENYKSTWVVNPVFGKRDTF